MDSEQWTVNVFLHNSALIPATELSLRLPGDTSSSIFFTECDWNLRFLGGSCEGSKSPRKFAKSTKSPKVESRDEVARVPSSHYYLLRFRLGILLPGPSTSQILGTTYWFSRGPLETSSRSPGLDSSSTSHSRFVPKCDVELE